MLPTSCRRQFFSGSAALLAACTALTGWAGGMQTASGSELSRMENGRWQPGPVTVVVSGNRPQETIAKQSLRYVGIDGRLSDLGDGRPAELVPLISDRWGSHFSWNGTGPMPEDQRRRLSDIVAQTKAAGQQLRFWATPESVALWTELADAGVDLIGTDELERLARFLESRRE